MNYDEAEQREKTVILKYENGAWSVISPDREGQYMCNIKRADICINEAGSIDFLDIDFNQ